MGRHLDIGDTRLYLEERGAGDPLILLHGGPGFDHHEFGDYLDPLADEFRLILLDMRAHGRSERSPPETWTVRQMAADLCSLASALGLERYAVLGHSYGALVALEHAVAWPGAATHTIVSHGVPSLRFYRIRQELAKFEPRDLREQIAAAWDALEAVETSAQMARPAQEQMPFHFKDPLDPRIADFARRTSGATYAPEVLRAMGASGYGGFDVEPRLECITQPVLVLTGRYERTCPVEAAEAIAAGVPNAELVSFERSAHMSFVEETKDYIKTVRRFLSVPRP